jgi:hypothetical protein
MIKKISLTLFWLFICLGFFLPGMILAEGSPRQAFLIQNSGWMEPFFMDPDSPMKSVLSALGDHLAIGGELSLASFNQEGHIPGRQSPHVVYKGPFNQGAIRNALTNIDLPRRPDGHYADSDFQGALIGAINNILEGRPGVIWMVTNNKNAPDNDPHVQENTRAFFHQLRTSRAISRLVAYPLRMPVTGPRYSENGLIIYGIGYGDEGGSLLDALIERVDRSGLFADPAVVLKPLDVIPLRFIPSRIYPFDLKSKWDGNYLIVEGLDGGKPQEILIEGQLQSKFYPHVIDEAMLMVGWEDHSAAKFSGLVDVAVSPDTLYELKPLDKGLTITLRLRVPGIERPAGFGGLFVDRTDLAGFLDIDLQEVSLSFIDGFSAKMEMLYGLDQLPTLFFDNKTITHSKASIPVRITAHYSLLPLIISLGVIFAVVLGGAGFWFLSRTPRTDMVQIDGQPHRVNLRPFQSKTISDSQTGRSAKITMGFTGKASVKILDDKD